MKHLTNKQQRGAVLAFSLVMLLLLTLVSLSMIRQNKSQINIASNTGQQVRAFATVETALRQTQAILEPLRYQDKATKHCLSGPTSQIHEGRVLTGLPTGITATVTNVYCLSNYSDVTKSGDEFRCMYSAPNTRITGLVTTTDKNELACRMLDASGGWTSGMANPNGCQVEVYTLNVNILDAATNANRTVESKFQIDCSGDQNP